MTKQEAIAILSALKNITIVQSFRKKEKDEAGELVVEALDMACLALEDLEVEDG